MKKKKKKNGVETSSVTVRFSNENRVEMKT